MPLAALGAASADTAVTARMACTTNTAALSYPIRVFMLLCVYMLGIASRAVTQACRCCFSTVAVGVDTRKCSCVDSPVASALMMLVAGWWLAGRTQLGTCGFVGRRR
jgi:hypothetical protein